MATRSFTAAAIHERFPPGTTVSVHKDNGLRDGAPTPVSGSSVATGTVDNAGLAVSGLTAGVPYVLYAVVGGQKRFLQFRVRPTAGTPTTWADVHAARRAPGGDTQRLGWKDVVASRRAQAGTS